MRALAAALLLALALGCAGVPDEPAPAARPDPQWWTGTWRLDTEALAEEARAAGLPEDAREVTAALTDGLSPALQLTLSPSTCTLGEGQAEPLSVEQITADTATLRLGDGRRARLQRTERGARWRDGQTDLPLRRP